MGNIPAKSTFRALVQRPADPGSDKSWAFVQLTKAASDQLPRRGRITVEGAFNGVAFQETLEPDGQLGHWLRVGAALRHAAAADFGAVVTVEISPMAQEPDPGALGLHFAHGLPTRGQVLAPVLE